MTTTLANKFLRPLLPLWFIAFVIGAVFAAIALASLMDEVTGVDTKPIDQRVNDLVARVESLEKRFDESLDIGATP